MSTNLTPPTIYTYHPDSGEYTGETQAYLSPLDTEPTWLLIGNSTFDAPPTTEPQQAAVYRNGAWTLLPDWREIPLWRTADAQPVSAALGEVPEGIDATELAPPAFAVWTGKKWRTDSKAEAQAAQSEALAAAQSELARLMALAGDQLALLQDAVDLEMATEAEAALLVAWRKYRVQLSRVPQQAVWPVDVAWPELPEA